MAYFGAPPAGGFNPRWGRDDGIQPPHGGGYVPQPGVYGAAPAAQGYGYMPQPQAPGYYYPPGATGMPAQSPAASGYTYISGMGGGTRHPQPYPIVNPDLPAANMTNSTGGVGCEPGYNYFFPLETTKVHVIKSGSTPPWELPRHFSVPFHACHVPVTTTVGDLLKGMGATNPVAKKNKVWEVVQGGNGKWYKGIGYCADDGPAMEKTLKEIGWDGSRTGNPGGKPVVYLYITKD
jgi:hypothetical protein